MEARSRPSRANFWQRLRADLRADRRKGILLCLLVPLLLIAWVPVFAGGEATVTPGTTPDAQPAPLPAPLPTSGDEGYPVTVDGELHAKLARLVERLDRPWSPTWRPLEGSEPFSPGAPPQETQPRDESQGAVDADAERELAAELVPTSTVLSEIHGNVTIIAGQSYRSGDQVGQFVVGDIGARSVVLHGRFDEYEQQILLEDEGEGR